MLKLTRGAPHREIAIRLRDNEPLLNKKFGKAFLIAIALHLAGFAIVGITSMKPSALLHYSTVITTADMGIPSEMKGSLTALYVDDQGLLPRYVLEPEASIPLLPEMPDVQVKMQTKNQKELSNPGNQFTQVEKIPFLSLIQPISFGQLDTPVRIRISGELALREASSEGMESLMKELQRRVITGVHSVKVEVRVDDRTGEVFWAAVRHSSRIGSIDSFALEVAKNLLFDRQAKAFVSEGEVEILFNFAEDSLSSRSQMLGHP
ncbi:MAG: hypothetical protein ACI9S8_001982 [Chlamydiales bacterium]|jgi:hypothetical protein